MPSLLNANILSNSIGTKKSLSLFFLVTVILLQGFSLIFSNKTHAAVTDDPKTQAMNWALLNGLEKCMDSDGQKDANGFLNTTQSVTQSHAKSGDWYNDDARRSASYIISGKKDGSGKTYCNAMVKTAASEWGFSSPIDMLCSFVKKRDNGSSCKTGSGDFGYFGNLHSNFRKAIIKKVWGGKTPTPSSPGYFLLFRTAFADTCKPKVNKNASGEFKYTIKQVYNTDSGPIVKDVTYEGKKHSTKTNVYTSDSLNEVERDCKYIAGKISEHAADFAKYLEDNPEKAAELASTGDTENSNDSDEEGTSCALDGVGWIVCPVASFIGKLNDALFGMIKGFLEISPSMFSSGGDTFRSWGAIRNLANVAFVISFLVIIYSQITGFGVSNYGLKKLLPRLIIGAILVNVSFWICAIAVDLSNIIGSSLYDLLGSVLSSSSTKGGGNLTTWDDVTGWVLSGAGSALAIGGASIAVGSYGFFGALSLLIPGAVIAVLAFFMVIAVLIARQALVIILIVISPLAFVAYLLPNTEQWFDRWKKLLMSMLVLYPTVALLFGGSELAASVIRSSTDNALLYIASLIVTALPLFALPLLMRATGGILGKVGAFVNNPNRGPLDKLRKGGEQYRKNQEGRRNIQALNGGKVFGGSRLRNKARKEAIAGGIEREASREKSSYVARELDGNDSFAQRVAGGTPGRYGTPASPEALSRALAGARLTIDKATADEIEAEAVMVRNMDSTGIKDAIAQGGQSDARQAAMLQRLIKIGDPGGPDGYADEVNSAMSSSSETVRRATAEALSKDGPGFIKASDVDRIASGNHTDASGAQSTLQSIARDNVKTGVLSEQKMADSTVGDLQFAFDHADQQGQQRMVDTAAALKTNENLKGAIKHNAQAIDNLSKAVHP